MTSGDEPRAYFKRELYSSKWHRNVKNGHLLYVKPRTLKWHGSGQITFEYQNVGIGPRYQPPNPMHIFLHAPDELHFDTEFVRLRNDAKRYNKEIVSHTYLNNTVTIAYNLIDGRKYKWLYAFTYGMPLYEAFCKTFLSDIVKMKKNENDDKTKKNEKIYIETDFGMIDIPYDDDDDKRKPFFIYGSSSDDHMIIDTTNVYDVEIAYDNERHVIEFRYGPYRDNMSIRYKTASNDRAVAFLQCLTNARKEVEPKSQLESEVWHGLFIKRIYRASDETSYHVWSYDPHAGKSAFGYTSYPKKDQIMLLLHNGGSGDGGYECCTLVIGKQCTLSHDTLVKCGNDTYNFSSPTDAQQFVDFVNTAAKQQK